MTLDMVGRSKSAIWLKEIGSATNEESRISNELNWTSNKLNWIEAVLSKRVEEHPSVSLVRQPRQISMIPLNSGFPIFVLDLGRPGLLLEFGGWHEEGMTPATVVNLIERSLSGAIRLTDDYLDGRPWRHTVEITDDGGGWSTIGRLGYLRFSLFKGQLKSVTRRFGVPESFGGQPR